MCKTNNNLMKKFKNLTYFTLAGVTSMGISSCGKYEDGPGFSLLSKKARVAGDWKVKSIGSQVMGGNYSINMIKINFYMILFKT